MAGEWLTAKISDCFELVGGYAFKSGEFIESGIPVIKIKNVKANRMLFDNLSYVAPEFLKSRAEKVVQKGDLLITMSGNRFDGSPDTWVGKVAQFNEDRPFMLNQRVGILRPKKGAEVDRRFFAFSLSSHFYQTEFIAIATSSGGQANLSPSQILGAPIEYPPLAEQKAIASVLGALDDKIELNRRMNATLEAMARALFQSWFVDFDPVRAKLDGRKPIGLDETTAALFPDSFQESSLGHIPKGWEVRSLDKTAQYLNGLALQKYPPGDGPTLPVIKIAQLRKGDSVGSDRCNTELPANYIIQDGDVLFSWSGSLEVELWCGGPGALNQHLFKVTSPEFPKWFYYLWTLCHLDEFRLIAAGKATTMGHIQRGHLTAAKVLIPPRPLLDAMTRTMSPLIDQFIANRIQSRTLATLRDTLLPKLLSGELSVS